VKRGRARCAGLLLALACAAPIGGDAGLGELHPTVLPWRGRVDFFTCRFTTDAPIGVWLGSTDATERQAVARALEAWERAGLGVRFEVVAPDEAQIWLDVVDAAVGRDDGSSGTGRAIVDCRLDPSGDPASARIEHARVEIARSRPPDWRGRVQQLSQAELAGTALHELGHALGFQGHVRRGRVAMAATPETLRALGARVLARKPIPSGPVAALYARPSGSLLHRSSVPAWRTDLVDRMARVAEREGLDGPFARVGDVSARVFWRDASGAEYGLLIPGLEQLMTEPERVIVLPEANTRSVLPRSRDARPQ